MRTISFCQAINEALHQSMARDPRIFVIGEGADDPRAIFGSTAGLVEKFGHERVMDMPLSENGMTGVINGAALAGMRPVMTHQRIDFTLYAADQIINHAAKRSYTSGGRQSIPWVVRALVGRGWGQGSQHSQSLQALFAQTPGLKVVMPSNAGDAKGLLLASIEDDNPVIFIEHRRLYDEVSEVPEEYYTRPLGVGKIVRSGKDATVVAFGTMVKDAIDAADLLAIQGLTIEVIDPCTVKPLDTAIILDSVRKTGRLVVADTGGIVCGMASEVAAIVAEKAFGALRAPVRRIALPDIPAPSSYKLEPSYYPGVRQIAEALSELCGLKEGVLSGALPEQPREGAMPGGGPF